MSERDEEGMQLLQRVDAWHGEQWLLVAAAAADVTHVPTTVLRARQQTSVTIKPRLRCLSAKIRRLKD